MPLSESLRRFLRRKAVTNTCKRVNVDAAVAPQASHSQSDSNDSDQVDDVDNVEANDAGRDLVQRDNNAVCDVLAPVANDDDGDANRNDEGCNDLSSDDNCVECPDKSSGSEEFGSNSEDDNQPVLLTDAEKEQYVIDSIRDWAQQPGLLSMTKLDDLLHRLKLVFPRMPLTYTTLFQCNYDFDISHLPSGGTLWYKGICCNLDKLNLKAYLLKFQKIELDIGIDGLPLVGAKLWPILGHLVGTDNAPFIIAVYRGTSDPTNVTEYLSKYCNELQELSANGFTYDNRVYDVEIRYYICDAPARSFLKCTVRHNGYESCEKCTVVGEWHHNRVVLLDLDRPLRTDQTFRLRETPAHHKGDSPLENIGTRMVSQFPLDPMHLVYAGVFKRLMEYWLYHVGPWKLHHEVVGLISSVFTFLRPYCPSDFNRKPCSLIYFKRLKCTQLRRMLLYDGILAFKDLVDENIYKNFLLLHCSMYITSSKHLIAAHRGDVKEFVLLFVTHAAAIYGNEFVVYNVHNLPHMVEECLQNSVTLEEVSAFKFENRLKMIKDTLRSGLHQLQQLARRDEEKQSDVVKLSSKATHVVLSLKKKQFNAGALGGQHFRRLKAGSLLLRVGKSDCCLQTRNGDIVILKDIVLRQKKIFLIGSKFLTQQDFYTYPIPSSELGIFRVAALEKRLFSFRLKDIKSKCYLMPDGDNFLCVPILHSSEAI